MAKAQRMARKLGWLVACLWIAGAGCDDDKAADGDEHSGDEHEGGDEHGGGAGSGDHHTEMIGPLTGAECTDKTLTYQSFGKKFMDDYCVRCHGSTVKGDARNKAPADHNFDTLADVDLLKSHIDQYAGSGPKSTNTTMPPSDPKPSKEDREKLSQWIACGVPK